MIFRTAQIRSEEVGCARSITCSIIIVRAPANSPVCIYIIVRDLAVELPQRMARGRNGAIPAMMYSLPIKSNGIGRE